MDQRPFSYGGVLYVRGEFGLRGKILFDNVCIDANLLGDSVEISFQQKAFCIHSNTSPISQSHVLNEIDLLTSLDLYQLPSHLGLPITE